MMPDAAAIAALPGWVPAPSPGNPRLLVAGGVRVAPGPQAAGQVGELEGVPAEDVDVVAHERREPGDVLVSDLEAVVAELVERGVQVNGC
nr:hypothetical protein [Streptomyces hygroscopicus]